MTTLVYLVIDDLRRRLWSKANKEELIDAINVALNNIGRVTLIDTSLTVVDNQLSYDLPSTTTYDTDTKVYTVESVRNVVRVQVATSTSGDYDYETVYNWREKGGDLIFQDELDYTAGRTIKVFYNMNHPRVDVIDDNISDDIPIPLIAATAAYYYYLKQYANGGTENKHLSNLLESARREKMEAEMKYRIRRINRDPILN